MRQLTVELKEEEMERLEAVARARHTDPVGFIRAEVLKALTPGGTPPVGIVTIPPSDAKTREDRRQARLAVLMRSNGIWAGDPNKPKDGLAYQEELRAEWR